MNIYWQLVIEKISLFIFLIILCVLFTYVLITEHDCKKGKKNLCRHTETKILHMLAIAFIVNNNIICECNTLKIQCYKLQI